MDRTSAVHAPVCGGGRFSDRIGVVDRKCMQIPQLTKATLDVRHVDLDIILEATRKQREDNSMRNVQYFEAD